MSLTISDHYLEFTPAAAHRPECRNAGTNVWEVSRHHRLRLRAEADGGEYIETTIRLLCRSCGVVQLDQAEGWSTATSSTDQIGYGRRAERCAGLWLHPGPIRGVPMGTDEQDAPETYLVTGSPNPPQSTADVIGIVGWVRPWLGTRHGAPRWWGGHRPTERGGYETTTEPKYKNRTAAARWVADRHAAAGKASAAKS